jgi:hypothetical protein
MSDPRFFRKYLDILDEQPTSATVNFDDNTSMSVDTAAKTISGKTKVGDNLGLEFTHDRSAIPATQIGANYQVDPTTNVGAKYTQAGYKGQMTPTSQITANYNSPDVGEIIARANQGAFFQGSGKNAQQGNPAIVTAKVTNPQGQTATYNTNRNL